MFRISSAFSGRAYYTMTPQRGLNKTAPAAVLHGSIFSKPCAPAQERVRRTRAAAQAAALGVIIPYDGSAEKHQSKPKDLFRPGLSFFQAPPVALFSFSALFPKKTPQLFQRAAAFFSQLNKI
ncbi:hypothetical protein [Ruthenibacterium lactatiformans]|uniref:hypothetical protein n=2 Tax=Ruthenibacterium lactatiformans TaxID=1550024 RepID=UPI00131454F9|nr:hypothetical protein [Ruthenibacterium lactatiformans]